MCPPCRLAGLAGLRIGPRLRGAAVGVAAGILLAVALADLFPEALAEAGAKTASLWFLVGFAVLFVVEVVTRGHTHHEAGEEHVEHSSLTPFVTGLLLHNFVDGAVLAAGREASAEVGTAIAIGIVVHQLPVGLSFAAVVATVPGGRERARTWAVVLGAAIPAGPWRWRRCRRSKGSSSALCSPRPAALSPTSERVTCFRRRTRSIRP